MDQKKTGLFLKQLRNEKNLTQEQLAKKFNVTNRSVSRWETGSNLPDISLLVEIADFYEVDVREIIDGERKSEMMDNEIREVAGKMADYSNNEKKGHFQWVQVAGIAGVVLSLLALIFQFVSYEPDFKRFLGLFLTFLVLMTMSFITFYVTGVLQKLAEHKKLLSAVKVTIYVMLGMGVCFVVMSAVAVATFYFAYKSATVEMSTDPAAFTKYIHEADPNSEYSYGNMKEFNVFPAKLTGLNVTDYQLTYYNAWDPQYVIYLTVDYDADAYKAEMNRLKEIGIEEDYTYYYSVTGEPEGFDLVAMDCDEYMGFIYAMIPEGETDNTKITYVALWFCNYFYDLDNYQDYIPNKYMLPGFDATIDNEYMKKVTRET